MKVLSLFDGISGAMQALKNLKVDVNKYYAIEIDKYAKTISEKNHPEIIQLGDITKITDPVLSRIKEEGIDLLIGGSPCQNLSCAGDRTGLAGEKSVLFFEYLRILNYIKPKYFILENVYSMGKKNARIITDYIGVEPIMINSSLVTAQSRKRYYWTNIPGIKHPNDRHIYLKDILLSGETEDLKSYCVTSNYGKLIAQDYLKKKAGQMVYDTIKKLGYVNNRKSQGYGINSINGKSETIKASGGGLGTKTGLYETNIGLRKLHPIECERLQGFPDKYTEGCSNTQRYKMLGNSFTVPVIEYLLKPII